VSARREDRPAGAPQRGPEPETAGWSPSRRAMRLARHASLRQLQVFEAIARLGSFTRAAEELFLAQPTVSTQIKRLTAAVGAPLFDQVGRGIHLTEAGQALLDAARQIFDALERVEMKVADLKGLKQGYLRLGVITIAKYFAPGVLGAFCQKHPGVEVSLEVTNREHLLERMSRNEDDLYIVGQVPRSELDLEVIPFAPNPLHVLAHPEHPLASARNIPLERLTRESFIMRERGSGTRATVERMFEEKGLKPRVRMELGSNEAIKQAIMAQLGISVLSLHTVTLEAGTGPLAILDVEGFPIQRTWNVVYPKGKELSVVARAFVEFLQGEEAELAAKMARTEERLRR
jgi:DNA-binding transcriptional LysR family regulator